MNVKPGDLAIVIKAHIPENVGKIVRVQKFMRNDELFGPLWQVECESIRNTVGRKTLKPMKRGGRPLYAPDDWMRPVSGLPLNDEVTDDIKEPA